MDRRVPGNPKKKLDDPDEFQKIGAALGEQLLLLKELGIRPEFGPLEPEPCPAQRALLVRGLMNMPTAESRSMMLGYILKRREIETMTGEQLLGERDEYQMSCEEMEAAAEDMPVEEYRRQEAEKKRKYLLKRLDREIAGEAEEL